MALPAMLGAMLSAQSYWVNGTSGVDQAGNGTSPTSPWRTVTYALTHATAPLTGAAVVHLAGDQTYTAGTNGETFPLQLPPRIGLLGEPGTQGHLPVLQPSPTTSAITMASTLDYPDDYVACRSLVFLGGANAITLGALPGKAHRCRMEECEIRQAATAGLELVGAGGTDEATLVRVRFVGVAGTGVGLRARFPAAVPTMRITARECAFEGLPRGIEALGTWMVSASGTLDIEATACTFTNCGVGIDDQSEAAAAAPRTVVTACRFKSCGIGVQVQEPTGSVPSAHAVDVESSLFVGCGTGVRIDANSMAQASPYTAALTVGMSTFTGCSEGITAATLFHGYQRLQVEDCSFLDNVTAIRADANYADCGMFIGIRRSRILGGTAGVRTDLYNSSSRLEILCTVLAEVGGEAVRYRGYQGAPGYPSMTGLSLRHLTLANNSVGVVCTSPGANDSLSHIAFAGNAVDFVLPAQTSIDYCLSDGSLPAGAGNLGFTNPQLLPGYSLAPTSPCIDAGVLLLTPALDYERDPRAVAGGATTAALPDIGADEYVPAGSLRSYGTPGCGSFATQPRIGSPQSTAPLGGSFDVVVTDAQVASSTTASLALLGVGLADDNGALPFDLAILGLDNSYLWTVPVMLFGPRVVDSMGRAVVTQTVPAYPTIAGLSVHYQWLVLLPNLHSVTSDALRVKLGN